MSSLASGRNIAVLQRSARTINSSNKPFCRTFFSNPNVNQANSSEAIYCGGGKLRIRNQVSKALKVGVVSRTFFSRISCDNGINEGANEAAKAIVESSAAAIQPYETLYFGTRAVIESLEWFHVATGCPYWTSIIIGTVALRVVLFPVGVMTAQASARMASARPGKHNDSLLLSSSIFFNDSSI